jgi:hypothetical protein
VGSVLHWYVLCMYVTSLNVASSFVFSLQDLPILCYKAKHSVHIVSHYRRSEIILVHISINVRQLKKTFEIKLTNNNNSVSLVRERTISTEKLPLVGEVSANICGQRVSRGQRHESPTAVFSAS